MRKLTLYILWGFLYIACAILGFLPATNTAILAAVVAASVIFFLPPTLLLSRAVKEKDKKTIKIVFLVSLIWLITALILLLANILSVGASQLTGDVLYYMLVIVASPMICSRLWVLPLFLMACLMIASRQQLKKKK